MKICLLQCNVVSGDLQGNKKILINTVKGAPYADLCVAPVEALAGPGVQCLLDQPEFGASCHSALREMAKALEYFPALLCGLPDGKAVLLANGLVVDLPGLFYFHEHSIALVEKNSIIPQEADLLMHVKASPFSPGNQERLENWLHNVGKNALLALSVNLVGGYGEVVYAGQSFAVAQGIVCGRAKAFHKDMLLLDTNENYATILSTEEDPEEAQWLALVTGVRDFCHKCGASDVLLGLSGGMDSAFVACVAAEALGPEHVTGVLMPSPFSSEGSVADSMELAQNLGLKTIKAPIEPAMRTFEQMLAPCLENMPPRENDLTMENLQARLRAVTLMALANRSGALLLNTGNKSEASMGYCTLYGDAAGALAVIGDIFKTRVYELAAWYCKRQGKMIIPQAIFDKEPSAELRPDQKDSDSLPPYEELDPMLKKLFSHAIWNPGQNKELKELREKVVSSRFKRRQSPPVLLVGNDHIDDCDALLGGKLNLGDDF